MIRINEGYLKRQEKKEQLQHKGKETFQELRLTMPNIMKKSKQFEDWN